MGGDGAVVKSQKSLQLCLLVSLCVNLAVLGLVVKGSGYGGDWTTNEALSKLSIVDGQLVCSVPFRAPRAGFGCDAGDYDGTVALADHASASSITAPSGQILLAGNGGTLYPRNNSTQRANLSSNSVWANNVFAVNGRIDDVRNQSSGAPDFPNGITSGEDTWPTP